jgi:hypothetical protein
MRNVKYSGKIKFMFRKKFGYLSVDQVGSFDDKNTGRKSKEGFFSFSGKIMGLKSAFLPDHCCLIKLCDLPLHHSGWS